MAELTKAQLEAQNQAKIQPTITAEKHRSLNTDMIASAVNRKDDINLLGGGQSYNPTTSTGYAAGALVSFDDGGGVRSYSAIGALSPNPGTFNPLDWTLIETTPSILQYDATIFVDDAGNDTNTGQNQATPVKTATKGIELANALIVGGATSVCVLVYSGDHSISGLSGYESGITVQGLGFPKISFGNNAPNTYGGTFDLTVNGIEVTGTGGNILNSNTSGETATVFNVNLIGCKLSWTSAAETNGLIGILDDTTVHTLNLNARGNSGNNLKVVTQNVNYNLNSSGNVIEQYVHVDDEGLGTAVCDSVFTGSEFGGFTAFSSTSASSAYDTNVTVTFNGLSVKAQSGNYFNLSKTTVGSTLTVKTVGSSYFPNCPINDFIIGLVGTLSYEGPGTIKGSDGDVYNPAPTSFLDNQIVVTQANVSTTLGGVIDSTKEYFIDGVINMTGVSIEVPAGGIHARGYDFNISGLICSDAAYTLFTSPVGGSGDVIFFDFKIEVTGAGSKVYDLTDSNGFHAYEISKINFNDCTSLGTINGYRQGLEVGTGYFGGTPELTLDGTWLGGYFIDTSIIRNLIDGAYSLYKAGATFLMNSRFRSNQNMDLNTTVSFVDFATANFPNPSTLQLDKCLITRNGVSNALDSSIIPNISKNDIASAWIGNFGISNTFVGGKQRVTAASATVIVSGSTYYPLNATWAANNLAHFDAPAAGQLRHLGVNPIEFRVYADFTIEGTTANEIAVRIKKWDNSASSFLDFQPIVRPINALVGGRDVAFIPIVSNIALDTNDYLVFEVANNSGNDNVTLELDSFFVIEER